MTDQRIRTNTPRLHQPPQRDLEGEQHRLRVHRLIQQTRQIRTRISEGDLTHRTQRRITQLRIQRRTDLVKRSGEHRERGTQIPAHPRTLSTLTSEREHHPPRRTRDLLSA